jgi:hypothetical protein
VLQSFGAATGGRALPDLEVHLEAWPSHGGESLLDHGLHAGGEPVAGELSGCEDNESCAVEARSLRITKPAIEILSGNSKHELTEC